MDATAAERQRRYRAHKRGNHALCDPARCSPGTVTQPVTPVTAVTVDRGTPAPSGLGPRGRRLWAGLLTEAELAPAQLVLAEEACRIADRLDRLDRLLGDSEDQAWMRLQVSEDGAEVTVVVDRVLSEARQQAVALKQLVAELRQAAGGKPAAKGGGLIDQLAARRAARVSGPTGS